MNVEEVNAQLQEHGIFLGNAWARDLASNKLAKDKRWTKETLPALVQYCVESTSLNDPPSFIASKIQNDGWVELWEDLRKVRRSAARRRSRVSRVIENLPDRGRDWATKDNPAGWCTETFRARRMNELRKEEFDHSEPGKWNAYRCAFNGPEGERRETCTLYGHEGEELESE